MAARRPRCLCCNAGGHKFKNCPLCKKNHKSEAPQPEEAPKTTQTQAEQMLAKGTGPNLDEIVPRVGAGSFELHNK